MTKNSRYLLTGVLGLLAFSEGRKRGRKKAQEAQEAIDAENNRIRAARAEFAWAQGTQDAKLSISAGKALARYHAHGGTAKDVIGQLQQYMGLPATGVYDASTVAKMKEAVAVVLVIEA